MSILGNLFEELMQGGSAVEHPCANCPSTCAIAPQACDVCRPYKEQLIDAIYNVEHKDEFMGRYEVAAGGVTSGTVTCPHCGGPSANAHICEYCGSVLDESGSGKIKVKSAADIPNPVLIAQDIIFERCEAVRGYASADSTDLFETVSEINRKGLLGTLIEGLFDEADSSSESRMTEAEIEQMAASYGVSVARYLEGLDNGLYLTLTAKKAKEKQAVYSTSGTFGMGPGMGRRMDPPMMHRPQPRPMHQSGPMDGGPGRRGPGGMGGPGGPGGRGPGRR